MGKCKIETWVVHKSISFIVICVFAGSPEKVQ